jgi:type I restriction enzyme S subunit
VKRGYKQTEVGVIPIDWDETVVGAHLREAIRNGYSPVCPEQPTGVWILSLAALTPDGFDATGIKPAPLRDPQVQDNLLRDGDLLVSRANTPVRVGLAGIYRGTPTPCAYPDLIMRVRVSTSLDSDYLLLHLLSARGRKHLSERARGSSASMVKIDGSTLRALPLPFPPVAEQRAIAAALSDVDALIGALDRLIAKKRDLKQATMQQLLTGQTRLPGFGGKWGSTALGEIGECVIGLTYKPENVVDHGLLVLRSSNVQNGRLEFADNVYVNVPVSKRLHTQLDDILVCVRNGSRALIGKCALIDEQNVGHSFGAFMSVFRTKFARFVFYSFQSQVIQRQIRDNIGATINQITNKDMRALTIALPRDEEERNAITAVLTDMDAELTALEARRDKTRLLKQGMMQELLTGRTRLV